MKYFILVAALFVAGAFAAPVEVEHQLPRSLDPRFVSHGRPGCRTAEEMAIRLYRHNWDPTSWWQCNHQNVPADMMSCPANMLFDERTRTCIPAHMWIWTETRNPPSLAEWNGVPPSGGICPQDNPSCPPCPTPCPPCPPEDPPTTTTTPCPPCPTTTTPCPPCPTTTTTPCPPCPPEDPPTTTTTPCPPCPTTTTPCPPCPPEDPPTTTVCPPCPNEMICEQQHMGMLWPGSSQNTFLICHTVNHPAIEMTCDPGTIFNFNQQRCL